MGLTLSASGRPLLYYLTADIAPSIVAELDSSEWQLTPQFNQLRYITNPTPDSALANLTTSILAQQYRLLEQIWDGFIQRHVWAGTSLSQLLAHSQPYCEILKDLPGMTTSVHVDHRSCITAGMLFFNTVDNELQSTSFYASEKGDNALRMSSQLAHGWYTANWHKSWHKGSNSSTTIRYAVKFGLHLPMINP